MVKTVAIKVLLTLANKVCHGNFEGGELQNLAMVKYVLVIFQFSTQNN
jgi:hypothetical protein